MLGRPFRAPMIETPLHPQGVALGYRGPPLWGCVHPSRQQIVHHLRRHHPGELLLEPLRLERKTFVIEAHLM